MPYKTIFKILTGTKNGTWFWHYFFSFGVNEVEINGNPNTKNSEQFFIKDLRPKIVLKFPNNSHPSPIFLEVAYKSKRTQIMIAECKE